MSGLDRIQQCIMMDLRNKKYSRNCMNGYEPTRAGQSKGTARAINRKHFKSTLKRLKYLRRLEKAYA